MITILKDDYGLLLYPNSEKRYVTYLLHELLLIGKPPPLGKPAAGVVGQQQLKEYRALFAAFELKLKDPEDENLMIWVVDRLNDCPVWVAAGRLSGETVQQKVYTEQSLTVWLESFTPPALRNILAQSLGMSATGAKALKTKPELIQAIKDGRCVGTCAYEAHA
jgi:hypothetical protein